MTTEFQAGDFDRAIGALRDSCARPVKEWTDEEIQRALSYAVDQVMDTLNPEFEKRNRAALEKLGVPGELLEEQILKGQADTLQIMLSVIVRVAGEMERRDPGAVIPEHRWRPRFREVLGHMLARRASN